MAKARSRSISEAEKKRRCRKLNDRLRTTFKGGEVELSEGVKAFLEVDQEALFKEIRAFSGFNQSNDPFGDHHYCCVECEGYKYAVKIEAFDRRRKYGSVEPWNPKKTLRVMTIQKYDEYAGI